jgi:hypothetical protein
VPDNFRPARSGHIRLQSLMNFFHGEGAGQERLGGFECPLFTGFRTKEQWLPKPWAACSIHAEGANETWEVAGDAVGVTECLPDVAVQMRQVEDCDGGG